MAGKRLAVLFAGLALAGTVAAADVAKPAWTDLSSRQREVLAPLEDDWNGMDAARRKKWVGIANRYDRLSPQEQSRVRERMQDWARLAPEDRARARDQYRALRSMREERRQALGQEWQRYRSLPLEERRREAKARSSMVAPSPQGDSQ